MNLTASEAILLLDIVNSDYHDGRDVVGDPVWSSADLLASRLPKSSIAGVMASLSKKGAVRCQHAGADSTVEITQAGLDAILEADGGQ